MKDLTQKLEKLRVDAEDCLLISRLATDETKRHAFSKIAAQLQQMAVELEALIASKRAAGET